MQKREDTIGRSARGDAGHLQHERSRRKKSPCAAAARHCSCVLLGLTFTAPDIRAVLFTKKLKPSIEPKTAVSMPISITITTLLIFALVSRLVVPVFIFRPSIWNWSRQNGLVHITAYLIANYI